ncbi:MAG: TolC family protein [Gammaproteobacteria bacterium]
MKRLPLLLTALALAWTGGARAQSATLGAYIDEALRANPALQAQAAATRASAEAAAAARAQQLPSLALNARYTRAEGGRTIDFPAGDLLNGVYATLNRFLEERGEPAVFPQIENQSIALLREKEQETKLSLTAPLYAPQLWARADAQVALHGASLAEREAYARVLVREVKRAYYGAVQAEAAERILAASEALLAEDVRVSQALVDAGKATRDRVLRAQAERLDVVQRQDEAAVLAAQARRRLNILRDQPADAALVLPPPESLERPPPLPLVGPDRPELRQLDRTIAAADAGRRAAGGALLPTLALAADYGVQGTDYELSRDDDFATVSLVLNWSLWDFGARSAQKRQAIADAERLRAQRVDLGRQLDLAHWTAAEQLGTALRAIDAAQARLAAAEEVFRIAERKRAAAALSQVEFLDAERALTEARLNLAIARCTALDRAAELELASASYPLPARLLALAKV